MPVEMKDVQAHLQADYMKSEEVRAFIEREVSAGVHAYVVSRLKWISLATMAAIGAAAFLCYWFAGLGMDAALETDAVVEFRTRAEEAAAGAENAAEKISGWATADAVGSSMLYANHVANMWHVRDWEDSRKHLDTLLPAIEREIARLRAIGASEGMDVESLVGHWSRLRDRINRGG